MVSYLIQTAALTSPNVYLIKQQLWHQVYRIYHQKDRWCNIKYNIREPEYESKVSQQYLGLVSF